MGNAYKTYTYALHTISDLTMAIRRRFSNIIGRRGINKNNILYSLNLIYIGISLLLFVSLFLHHCIIRLRILISTSLMRLLKKSFIDHRLRTVCCCSSVVHLTVARSSSSTWPKESSADRRRLRRPEVRTPHPY